MALEHKSSLSHVRRVARSLSAASASEVVPVLIHTARDITHQHTTITQSDRLIYGPVRIKVNKVHLVDRVSGRGVQLTAGTLHLTTTHLIFATESDDCQNELWVLHGLMCSVQRGPITVSGCSLHIRCKHFQLVELLFARDKDCHDVYESLLALSQPMNLSQVYAFSYTSHNRDMLKTDGWDFDLREEYKRLGLPNEQWAATEFNLKYQYCDTYPEHLIVPSSVNTQMLIGSCSFRSKQRLPVLTYLHPTNHASICRCSQPLAGFSARCVEDEQMMQHIRMANTQCNVLYLLDTRPKLNAMFNKATGKGFEDERNYSNTRFHFFNIENIHVMRGSLNKLIEVVQRANNSVCTYEQGLEQSGWLRHVRVIMEAARFLCDSVQAGVSCVVHCSDGWDRTAQTVALAQLLLDPYYRTIQGFRALIEKDWLAFGHKFSDRCGHTGLSEHNEKLTDEKSSSGFAYAAKLAAASSGSSNAAKELSPVFVQWLDCVWQCQQQWPNAFEYNELLLIQLVEWVHSCQFGTFLGNCHKDRQDLRLSERTYSVWAQIRLRQSEFTNVAYAPTKQVLQPDVRIQSIKYWRSLYNRYQAVHITDDTRDTSDQLSRHMQSLTQSLTYVQQRISDLRSGAMKSNNVENHTENMAAVLHPLNGEVNTSSMNEPSESACVALKWQQSTFCSQCAHTFVHKEHSFNCSECGCVLCAQCAVQPSTPNTLCAGMDLITINHTNTNQSIRLCSNCDSKFPLITPTDST